MSILATYARPVSIPASSIPAGHVELPCDQCGDAFAVPASRSREPFTCRPCLRGLAQVEAQRILSDVAALRDGSVPFDALTLAERQEQLDALFGPGVVAAVLPSGETRRVVYDEPLYDSGGYEPDAATRDEIEARIELEPFDAEFGHADANGAWG